MTRRTEIIVAGSVIMAAAAVTAAVLVWHYGFDDAWWSLSLPAASDWYGFGVYAWAEVILWPVIGTVCAVAATFFAMRRRRSGASILTVGFPVVLAAGCAAIYWPFFGATVRRVDRVRRLIHEPAIAYRTLAMLMALTLVLTVLYLVATSMRHAPRMGGGVARVAIIVLAGVYLNLIWIPMFLPSFNDWQPVDWQHPDRLVPFRPCRGALLWTIRSDGTIIPVARIDDLWLRFADPRSGGREVRAISAPLEMRERYAWLNMAEAGALSVRSDDPAVRHCDSRWRNERVVPASWHMLGMEW